MIARTFMLKCARESSDTTAVKTYHKIIFSLLAALVAAVITFGWLDDYGRNYTEQGLKRSLVAYGIARGLNAVISVAQGTEVAVEPVGVGMTFTPGQILDPVNDLVERFSWIVLVSGVSLGAQRVLLSMTAWVWFSGLVGVCLATGLLLMWKPALLGPRMSRGVYKLAALLLVLRLAVPVIAVINEGIYRSFLAPQYEESMQKLEATTRSIEQSRPPPVDEAAGFMEQARRMMQSASSMLDIERQLAALKQTASEVSEYALNMIVVFVLQTLVFPLLFLWLAYRLLAAIIQYQPRQNPLSGTNNER